MSNDITLAQLQAEFERAAKTIDTYTSPVVKATLEKAKDTQRAHVPVDSGKTRDSIKVTGIDGAPWTKTTINGEVGPTWFVGRLIETGTVNTPPRPFVEHSLDPHMPAHLSEMQKAATNGALRALVT